MFTGHAFTMARYFITESIGDTLDIYRFHNLLLGQSRMQDARPWRLYLHIASREHSKSAPRVIKCRFSETGIRWPDYYTRPVSAIHYVAYADVFFSFLVFFISCARANTMDFPLFDPVIVIRPMNLLRITTVDILELCHTRELAMPSTLHKAPATPVWTVADTRECPEVELVSDVGPGLLATRYDECAIVLKREPVGLG